MSAGASAAAPRQPGGQARAASATQQPPTLRHPGGHRAGCQKHALLNPALLRTSQTRCLLASLPAS
eukprot:9858653-Alexandrium_andersonii.AAC.1